MAPVRLIKRAERLAQLVPDHLCAVDHEPHEDRPVQDRPHHLAAAFVHTGRVFEQVQALVEHAPPGIELLLGVVQAALNLVPFPPYGRDLLAQPLLGPAFLGRQVEEVVFLACQLGKPLLVLLTHVSGQRGAVIGGIIDHGTDLSAEVGRKGDGRTVVPDNRLFHVLHRHIRVVARAILPPHAEEVIVFATSSANGALHCEALAAAVAPDPALEVVRVLAFAHARTLMGVKYALHPVEERFGNERLMQATQLGWLQAYESELPEEYTAYISFEAEARSVRNYESLFVPGLLQTEDYARAVITAGAPGAEAGYIQRRVEARLNRQTSLTKKEPLQLWVIMDEAAVHRLVGGAEVMREQLARLADADKQPNIVVQVVPFTAGAHPGMPGSFAMMDFPDAADPELVYIDSMAGDLFLEREADLRRFTVIFDYLRAAALNPADSVRLIRKVAATMKA